MCVRSRLQLIERKMVSEQDRMQSKERAETIADQRIRIFDPTASKSDQVHLLSNLITSVLRLDFSRRKTTVLPTCILSYRPKVR